MDAQEKKVLENRVEKMVTEKLAPALDAKCSATVVFYGISDEGKAKMGLKTSCGNCPRAKATILQSVTVAVKATVPEVTGVEPFYK